ncbi:MAG: DUF3052 family protein [Pseudomonadota bacterium]
MAGYSGTPLAKKLSLKDGLRTRFEAMPDSVRAEIEAADLSLPDWDGSPGALDALHIFSTDAAALRARLTAARDQIAQTGFIWVSWPKKPSKMPTDITEDEIRAIALPMGLVDVKVCAIDTTWSGLKLMIRKELRR